MARVKVPFLGMTTRSNHLDGECVTIVNARPKNGAWRPVAPRKVVATLGDTYDIIFVHRGSGYENWIGTKGPAVYRNVNATAVHLATVDGTVNSVQQVGNTLAFVCDNHVFYALWNGVNYDYLGKLPQIPVVKFSTTSISTATRTYSSEYGSGSVDKDNILECTKGLLNKIIESNREKFVDGFVISWALRLYDGTLTKPAPPILVMPQENYSRWGWAKVSPRPFLTGTLDDTSSVNILLYQLSMVYDFSSLVNWKDVIKSVDFFISPYLGIVSMENIENVFWLRTDEEGRHYFFDKKNTFVKPVTPSSPRMISTPRVSSRDIVYETPTETIEEKAYNLSQLYLYYSVTEFTSGNVTFPNDKVTTKDVKNIVFQEMMMADPLSHHDSGSKRASVYNNRLRLGNVSTRLFNGFDVGYFQWHSKYNGSEYTVGESTEYWVYVHVKTDAGEKVVRAGKTTNMALLNGILSYPDPRATKMIIYSHETTGYWIPRLTVSLSPHEFLNCAYAIRDELYPFFPNFNGTPQGGTPNYDYNAGYTEQNKLKVSEVNNPFVFPNETTYQVGMGEILNESSIVMNVTDRNYGIYPVFVFTTDGVFTMAGQHGEAVHASIQAPTYMEPPINDVICPTPHGVAFITKRGLMLINQYKTESISEQLREAGYKLNVTANDIELPMLEYPGETFEDYLEGVTVMVYNQHEDELIVVNPEKPYNYVYDFRAKGFYLSTEVIDKAVQNVFPEVLVVGGTSMKDYKYPNQVGAVVPWQKVAIVTRPLRFGTTDKKKLDRAYFRGLIRGIAPVAEHGNTMIILFYSQDGVNFDPVRGMILREGFSYKDFDFGLMARTKWNYYMFAIAGTIASDSNLDYVEFEIAKEYDNEKMR